MFSIAVYGLRLSTGAACRRSVQLQSISDTERRRPAATSTPATPTARGPYLSVRPCVSVAPMTLFLPASLYPSLCLYACIALSFRGQSDRIGPTRSPVRPPVREMLPLFHVEINKYHVTRNLSSAASEPAGSWVRHEKRYSDGQVSIRIIAISRLSI